MLSLKLNLFFISEADNSGIPSHRRPGCLVAAFRCFAKCNVGDGRRDPPHFLNLILTSTRLFSVSYHLFFRPNLMVSNDFYVSYALII